MRQESHRPAPADFPVEVTRGKRGLPGEKLLIIRSQRLIQKNLFPHVFHVFGKAAVNRGIVVPVCGQNLPNLPQGHAVVAQADALDQKHGRVEGIIAIPAVTAAGLYDPLVFIVLQQVGGNPQVFGEFTDPVFPDLNHLRKNGYGVKRIIAPIITRNSASFKDSYSGSDVPFPQYSVFPEKNLT